MQDYKEVPEHKTLHPANVHVWKKHPDYSNVLDVLEEPFNVQFKHKMTILYTKSVQRRKNHRLLLSLQDTLPVVQDAQVIVEIAVIRDLLTEKKTYTLVPLSRMVQAR